MRHKSKFDLAAEPESLGKTGVCETCSPFALSSTFPTTLSLLSAPPFEQSRVINIRFLKLSCLDKDCLGKESSGDAKPPSSERSGVPISEYGPMYLTGDWQDGGVEVLVVSFLSAPELC